VDLAHVLLVLHISGMFLAILASYGPDLVVRLGYLTGQVAALRGAQLASERIGPLMPILYVIAGIFGLLTAISFGFNLLAPWLLIAYVLFAFAMATGLLGNRVFSMRLGAILATTPDGPVTPEIKALFSSTGHRVLTTADYVWLFAIVFDMVVKPFSS
jgi:hypothetical protein